MNATTQLQSAKKDKKQKNVVQDYASFWPAPGDTISLRECAKTLAVASSGNRKGVADALLLRELKAGSVCAGFHVGGKETVWVSIPTNYWMSVKADEFANIRLISSRGRLGSYTVELGVFAKEYTDARIRFADQAKEMLGAEWILTAIQEFAGITNKKFDVEISNASWEAFRSHQHVIQKPSWQETELESVRGRGAHAAWKEINAVLAAYLAKSGVRVSGNETAKVVAAKVTVAVQRMKPDLKLPQPQSIEKEVSRVFGLIEKLKV